jgi:hypothetical protein
VRSRNRARAQHLQRERPRAHSARASGSVYTSAAAGGARHSAQEGAREAPVLLAPDDAGRQSGEARQRPPDRRELGERRVRGDASGMSCTNARWRRAARSRGREEQPRAPRWREPAGAARSPGAAPAPRRRSSAARGTRRARACGRRGCARACAAREGRRVEQHERAIRCGCRRAKPRPIAPPQSCTASVMRRRSSATHQRLEVGDVRLERVAPVLRLVREPQPRWSGASTRQRRERRARACASRRTRSGCRAGRAPVAAPCGPSST